jgi:anti-anti-sigma factor
MTGPRLDGVDIGECEITAVQVDGLPGVAVAGELDAASCDELGAALARAAKRGGPVVLDLGACTFIDSSAVATIVRAVRSRRESQGLVVCNAHGFVAVVLNASGLLRTDGVFHGVYDGFLTGDGAARWSRNSAVAELSREAPTGIEPV